MSKTECVFWLGFWAIIVGGMVSCSAIPPPSVYCVKAGGDWNGWCKARKPE